ncbi:MAG: tRNA (N6-isopentenyl adenosine(37)-C2)-methylthiotransferase MiaB [bacterium]|nr:tRNA (N6-isopentenyl adenosine(37)-C2)-methylthiotransferase MiaB [bacterium]
MLTYHIITIGCQMNYADSERLASRLEQNGYKKTADKYGADFLVVNTCGVRQSAENRIYGLIPKIKKENLRSKIILTGCLAERKDVKRRLKDYVDIWLPIGKIQSVFRSINEAENEKIKYNYLEIKPNYESKFSAFLPIGNGCDNFCSYCVVPYARGRETYRSAKAILAEANDLVKKGYKEIILIAQNVNSYKSGKTDFADLLKAINSIKGDFWIRFLTSHPKDMSKKLIKTMADSDKVCKQIYLPVQAGDDKILKAMNRKYTVKHYEQLIKTIRQAMPEISVTTDLIVGFPGETKKQFNNSLNLFKQVKFDMAYISEYSARPGTAAFKLPDDVSRQEKKNRKSRLDKILRQTALINNKKYLGKTVRVLAENQSKAGEWFGKTATGKDIRFLAGQLDLKAGDFVNVKVAGVREFCLAGVLN